MAVWSGRSAVKVRCDLPRPHSPEMTTTPDWDLAWSLLGVFTVCLRCVGFKSLILRLCPRSKRPRESALPPLSQHYERSIGSDGGYLDWNRTLLT
jgi:hypothetical protein